LAQKILSLSPDNISEIDVKETLSLAPAPRIIILRGSLPLVSLESFARLLITMGYPEESIKTPVSGEYSYSSYINSQKLAGMIAWYYEHEGMMPMLIGYSQGGMKVIKVLYELSGEFHRRLYVFNPYTEEVEPRHTIHDPITGKERGVLGLKIGYASSIATGRLMRVLLGQWDMIGRLRIIPDTVSEFSGFYIKHDLIGSDLFGLKRANTYHPLHTAIVHTIELPPGNTHFNVMMMDNIINNGELQRWIHSYTPAQRRGIEIYNNAPNLLLVAEIWYYIKKHWCIELQQLIRSQWARRAF